MAEEKRFGFDTLAVHAGQRPDPVTDSRAVPINQFDVQFRKIGINARFVDIGNHEAVRKAIGPKTKCIFAETLGNPKIDVLDIEAVAKIAHDNGIPLVVDNTFASPYLCRPLEWGADIVVHSATKFICGHGTVIAGAIVDGGRFPWDNGNFPGMTEPSK